MEREGGRRGGGGLGLSSSPHLQDDSGGSGDSHSSSQRNLHKHHVHTHQQLHSQRARALQTRTGSSSDSLGVVDAPAITHHVRHSSHERRHRRAVRANSRSGGSGSVVALELRAAPTPGGRRQTVEVEDVDADRGQAGVDEDDGVESSDSNRDEERSDASSVLDGDQDDRERDAYEEDDDSDESSSTDSSMSDDSSSGSSSGSSMSDASVLTDSTSRSSSRASSQRWHKRRSSRASSKSRLSARSSRTSARSSQRSSRTSTRSTLSVRSSRGRYVRQTSSPNYPSDNDLGSSSDEDDDVRQRRPLRRMLSMRRRQLLESPVVSDREVSEPSESPSLSRHSSGAPASPPSRISSAGSSRTAASRRSGVSVARSTVAKPTPLESGFEIRKTHLLQSLYHLVWSEQVATDANRGREAQRKGQRLVAKSKHHDKYELGDEVRLPHTVVYTDGQPTDWYFRRPDGIVMRKSKKKITPQRIFSTLEAARSVGTAGRDEIDIVAVLYFIAPDNRDTHKEATSSGARVPSNAATSHSRPRRHQRTGTSAGRTRRGGSPDKELGPSRALDEEDGVIFGSSADYRARRQRDVAARGGLPLDMAAVTHAPPENRRGSGKTQVSGEAPKPDLPSNSKLQRIVGTPTGFKSVSVRFLNADMLRTFLLANAAEQRVTGVLQQFIMPIDHHNQVIRARWRYLQSEDRAVIDVDARRCVNGITALNKTMHERAATFENTSRHQSYVTDDTVDSDHVLSAVRSYTLRLVDEFSKVFEMEQLDLLFKVGEYGDLWLLGVSKLKGTTTLLEKSRAAAVVAASTSLSSMHEPSERHHEAPFNAIDSAAAVASGNMDDFKRVSRPAPSFSYVPPSPATSSANDDPLMYVFLPLPRTSPYELKMARAERMRRISLAPTFRCPVCETHTKRIDAANQPRVLVQQLINQHEHWLLDHFDHETSTDAEFQEMLMPPAVRRAFPDVTSAQYLSRKNNYGFVSRTVNVCGTCMSDLYSMLSVTTRRSDEDKDQLLAREDVDAIVDRLADRRIYTGHLVPHPDWEDVDPSESAVWNEGLDEEGSEHEHSGQVEEDEQHSHGETSDVEKRPGSRRLTRMDSMFGAALGLDESKQHELEEKRLRDERERLKIEHQQRKKKQKQRERRDHERRKRHEYQMRGRASAEAATLDPDAADAITNPDDIDKALAEIERDMSAWSDQLMVYDTLARERAHIDPYKWNDSTDQSFTRKLLSRPALRGKDAKRVELKVKKVRRKKREMYKHDYSEPLPLELLQESLLHWAHQRQGAKQLSTSARKPRPQHDHRREPSGAPSASSARVSSERGLAGLRLSLNMIKHQVYAPLEGKSPSSASASQFTRFTDRAQSPAGRSARKATRPSPQQQQQQQQQQHMRQQHMRQRSSNSTKKTARKKRRPRKKKPHPVHPRPAHRKWETLAIHDPSGGRLPNINS